MTEVITIHSFRGGTGKSTTIANMALLMAVAGRRVALVDMDIQSPSTAILFDIPDYGSRFSLADYLVGRCEIEDAAYHLPGSGDDVSALFLIPALTDAARIGEVLAKGYDVGLLGEGFDRLIASLDLDVLLLDTHSGISNETVTALASCDKLLVLTRPDRLDLACAEETLSLAARLGCPDPVLVMNMAPGGAVPDEMLRHAELVYGVPVSVVLPYSPAPVEITGADRPEHRLIAGYHQIVSLIVGSAD
ncbi:CDP-3, 6-dideoxy-D-glycero-L-glycero-4-hexulose-4-reductase [Planobispora rosea]|uniref:CDP-3, 6-dideoxy-D-glycero-L-glycero-4-hexulose-4-reductase n=1 Tax=Planobispora rosea TaxID=35762 RepID=A0A8J3WFE7_PLARO|nr:MinD/ParA family protein [Planobispora rosea]GGS93395.1 CDP-3, 6-dideoxy-D-glycero-L-glycero-4-hexulose-4-reductase [Planobispora rosea]GIH87258.1 CDP-3, 6-dideoxy-D-glycero-L-glycero-4-hexulose-4-reductase [Planobispora rosea]